MCVQVNSIHLQSLMDYIWISGNEKVKHIPQSQAATVDMEDHDENADEELDLLQRLTSLCVKSWARSESRERCMLSREREETQPEDGASTRMMKMSLDDAAPTRRPEDRHGQFLIRQLLMNINDFCMRLHSAQCMFSQVLIWKVVEHQCVVRSVISLCS